MLCSLLDQGKRESCPGMLLLQHACLSSGLIEWATLSSQRSDISSALRFFHSPQLSSSNNKRKHWEGRKGRLLLPKMPALSGHCILPTTWPLYITYFLSLEEISLLFFPPHFFEAEHPFLQCLEKLTAFTRQSSLTCVYIAWHCLPAEQAKEYKQVQQALRDKRFPAKRLLFLLRSTF